MKIIWHWLILSAAVFATTYIFPAKITVSPWYIALVVGACLMFVNTVIKPIISLLTLPINILTLGLFSVLINGLIFWALAAIIPGFSILTFGAAILGAIIVWLLNWILEKIF